jgi:hypothetical protein
MESALRRLFKGGNFAPTSYQSFVSDASGCAIIGSQAS